MDRELIKKIVAEVRERLKDESSGHDFWHVYRVWKMTQCIGKGENANMFVVELTALLHDIADWKFHGGDETIGPRVAGEILKQHGVNKDIIDHVVKIIANMSFKGAQVKDDMQTLEGKIVQDADRLDAIGAIGIARAFATGAKFDEILHDPNIKPQIYTSPEAYVASKTKKRRTVINHFYEKLLLLKDRMYTKTAKRIARARHQFIEKYLDRFFKEWEGKS